MALAQINYKVPPSTFVDSPQILWRDPLTLEILERVSSGSSCLTFSIESWKGSRVCVFCCDQFFVYSTSVLLYVFPNFPLKSTAWNCVGHHSSSCHVISLQYDRGIYRNVSNPSSEAAFVMFAV